ncbi:MAG: helix-turn-helix domain-containing protein [Opitutus sp.]|nr:helix-turn-helix domain-containing protein [Opitutus sp.]
MVTNKIKELEAARAKLASLEKAIADELNAELAALPAKFGFKSAADFVNAVTAATGTGPKRRGRKPGKAKAAAAAAAPAAAPAKAAAGGKKKRRTRAVITDETRAQVKKMVAAGKTGGVIAAALKISLPSVQNIKKALGLVKKR